MTAPAVRKDPPRPDTDEGAAYWADICGDQGKCGRPRTEEHDVHVWYSKGGKILATWRATE